MESAVFAGQLARLNCTHRFILFGAHWRVFVMTAHLSLKWVGRRSNDFVVVAVVVVVVGGARGPGLEACPWVPGWLVASRRRLAVSSNRRLRAGLGYHSRELRFAAKVTWDQSMYVGSRELHYSASDAFPLNGMALHAKHGLEHVFYKQFQVKRLNTVAKPSSFIENIFKCFAITILMRECTAVDVFMLSAILRRVFCRFLRSMANPNHLVRRG
ncbi:unnamed protein product [Caenorhabditis auriculariae]|uniref:Uncharacterized protein n=1 Tax=Caenorhabditis auriculariae TaxID=2777116 RepID=A0A8S1H0A0_9PELO|nr:unnamed protein product [Caenorhabditis auriculariae]